jgi:DNA-binding Xre family transcriptional regulator
MRKFNHIATLVKKKRLAHPSSLSQSDLSQLLGYKNGQFISNVERALCNIPFKMIGKLCKVLSIAPIEIKEAMLKDHEETLELYIQMGIEDGLIEGVKTEESAMTESNLSVINKEAPQPSPFISN